MGALLCLLGWPQLLSLNRFPASASLAAGTRGMYTTQLGTTPRWLFQSNCAAQLWVTSRCGVILMTPKQHLILTSQVFCRHMHECFLKTSTGAAAAFFPVHVHCLSCFLLGSQHLCYFPSVHTWQEISNFFLEQSPFTTAPILLWLFWNPVVIRVNTIWFWW